MSLHTLRRAPSVSCLLETSENLYSTQGDLMIVNGPQNQHREFIVVTREIKSVGVIEITRCGQKSGCTVWDGSHFYADHVKKVDTVRRTKRTAKCVSSGMIYTVRGGLVDDSVLNRKYKIVVVLNICMDLSMDKKWIIVIIASKYVNFRFINLTL